jgi:hypothetical protein
VNNLPGRLSIPVLAAPASAPAADPPAGRDHAINCTQIIRFGMASRNHLGAQVADHIGG